MSPDWYCPECDVFDYTPHAELPCVVRANRETVARIVAWLRAERAAWSTSTEAREICASLAWAADAIARGDWRAR